MAYITKDMIRMKRVQAIGRITSYILTGLLIANFFTPWIMQWIQEHYSVAYVVQPSDRAIYWSKLHHARMKYQAAEWEKYLTRSNHCKNTHGVCR